MGTTAPDCSTLRAVSHGPRLAHGWETELGNATMNRLTDSLLGLVLPYKTRNALGLVHRPQYGYCMWHAARLAQRLGHRKISVLEFGVAGGNGLVAIERHARRIQRLLPVTFEIYGFDAGVGLPPPIDFRDLPYHWRAGFFKMNEADLRGRLKTSKLILGPVKETTRTFIQEHAPPPIGCIFHDLDFYSSTRDSFQVLDGPPEHYLPRLFNYFDDIIGGETELYNDYTGQRLAISEFNQARPTKKIANVYHFARWRRRPVWHQQIFVLHDFAHPQYNTFVSDENQQLPLS
jgi:hypothetical protein